ncbi:hypothetical protein [Ornithinicoccus halotolerans]|uniref:hypothetical protein n=1 Tax=Ornithinicoccus halotolerans TaxID=1748220 RepID=UPI0012980488|nr:hypothetical protein [Ornithinicoccus halotolerans]
MTTEDPTPSAPDSPAGKLRQNSTGGDEPREQQQTLTDDPTAPRGQEPPEVLAHRERPARPASLVQLPAGATFGRSDRISPEERERLAAYAARALAELEGESDRRVLPDERDAEQQ